MTQNTYQTGVPQGQAGRQSHDVVQHPHGHGANCGHQSMQHGDHTDYVHDGHRHAEHQGHWDEHSDTPGATRGGGTTGSSGQMGSTSS